MAIKVSFLQGEDTTTVSGLYQWDYGQVLEIECADIGSEILEVHFASPNMTEAIVRPCTFANDIATVPIPDECLEQATKLTAWVYKVDSTQGHTIKKIILPITARTRPSLSRDIPAETIDKYGELIQEINEAVDALEKGNITAAKATHAVSADSATTAQNAGSASYATSAGSAITANHAHTSTRLSISIDQPVLNIEVKEFGEYSVDKSTLDTGLYLAILTFETFAVNTHFGYDHYSGIGYIGTADVDDWNGYEIGLGEDMFITVSDQGESSYKVISINIRENKGADLGKAGVLQLFKVAGFAQG